MKSARFVLASISIILSHVLMCAGQGGWGGVSGANTGTWSSANGQPGQPGGNGASAGTWSNSQSGQPGNGQTSYSYGGVDSNGVPYGGYGGNGGYRVNVTDEHGRQHTYSGDQDGYGNPTGQSGQPGTYSYANTNTYRYGKTYSASASSAYASAWSTFYTICLFSLFLIIKC